MKNKTFKIYTLGCKVNQYDSGDLKKKFESRDFQFVNSSANLVFINTCAVTKTAIHKNQRMINRARKENPKAKIILLGCWPKTYSKETRNLNVDYVFRVNEVDKIIKQMFNVECPSFSAGKRMSKKKLKASSYNKARYFIKIQDGCEQFCSYCIIPYARGKLKSRGEKEVLNEIKQAIESGYQEIVLSGIHLGLYGKEVRSRKLKVKRNLVVLIKKIITLKGLGRIRLSSIEVSEINNELINLIVKSHRICNHLHIPLQSGCDKILKLMNRPYTKKYFAEKIKKIRKLIPDIAITTDVIVGFPGETKKDFEETKKFIKKMKFSRLHVFPFSAHEKTVASKLPNKVDKKEIDRRARELRDLGKKLEIEYKKKFIDKKLEVIIEKKVGKKYVGKSEYYFDIEFISSKKVIIGSLLKVN